MIFIPKENIKHSDIDKFSEYIIWSYNEFVEIYFIHNFNDSMYYVKKISTKTENGLSSYKSELLKCHEPTCDNKIKLMYNGIIKKYFCICPASMSQVENTDEAEIEYFNKYNTKEFTEDKGFFDDPLKAVLFWQKSVAESHIIALENLITRFFGKNETNFEKYFANPKVAADTLEKILYGQIDICKKLCIFKDKDCTEELADNFHCNNAIKYCLQSFVEKDGINK